MTYKKVQFIAFHLNTSPLKRHTKTYDHPAPYLGWSE